MGTILAVELKEREGGQGGDQVCMMHACRCTCMYVHVTYTANCRQGAHVVTSVVTRLRECALILIVL
jgi:hypothetical protein